MKVQEQWNDVNDFLPEDLECVLCVNEFGGMWVDQFGLGEWVGEVPTHWMILPKAPGNAQQVIQPDSDQ
jgi:hypothetical protein